MITIGIPDVKSLVLSKNLIKTLLELGNLTVEVIDIKDYDINNISADADVVILVFTDKDHITNNPLNILVLNAENNYVHQNRLMGLMRNADYLIVDSDNRDLMNSLNFIRSIMNFNGVLITCGFNAKACVTTSSVIGSEYETIQVCIQHSFRTINNKIIDEQEFSLNISETSNDFNIFSILSGVISVLICGVNIKNIS